MQAVPFPAPGQPGEGYVSPTEAGRFLGVSRRAFEAALTHLPWVRAFKVSGKKIMYSAHDLAVVKHLLDLGEISPEIFSRSRMAQDGPS